MRLRLVSTEGRLGRCIRTAPAGLSSRSRSARHSLRVDDPWHAAGTTVQANPTRIGTLGKDGWPAHRIETARVTVLYAQVDQRLRLAGLGARDLLPSPGAIGQMPAHRTLGAFMTAEGTSSSRLFSHPQSVPEVVSLRRRCPMTRSDAIRLAHQFHVRLNEAQGSAQTASSTTLLLFIVADDQHTIPAAAPQKRSDLATPHHSEPRRATSLLDSMRAASASIRSAAQARRYSS